MAMAANGLIRATRDVDFVVASDEENIARLRAALRSVFDDPSIEEIDATELAGAYPVMQYFPPGEAYSVDIIMRIGEAFAYDDIDWSGAQRTRAGWPPPSTRLMSQLRAAGCSRRARSGTDERPQTAPRPRALTRGLVKSASGVARTSRTRSAPTRPSFAVGQVESKGRNGSAGVLRLRTFGDRC